MTYNTPILYGSLVLGLIAAVGIFLVALSLNDAIQTSINSGVTDQNIDGDLITARWIYFVVAAIVLLLIVWWIQARANRDIDRYVNYARN